MISLLILALSTTTVEAQEPIEGPPVAQPTAEPDASPEFEPMPIEQWALEDGTNVVLVSDHRVPLVTLTLVFPAGIWSPWMQDHHGEEAWTIQMNDEAGEFNRRADALATRVSLSVNTESALLSLTCLKEDLPQALTLLEDVVSGRDFMRDELKRWKKQSRIDWKGNLKNTEFQLERTAMGLLFEETDPRYLAWLEPASISQDIEALAQTRDTILQLPDRNIGFAGDLTREEAEALAPTLLPTAGEAPQGMEFQFQPVQSDRPERLETTLPKLTQIYLAHTSTAPSWDDPLYPAFLIAQHVLGGHFHSRLYIALRHDDGDTYGARARSRVYAETGSLGLYTFTRLDNADPIEAKLRATLEEFHANGITEEERIDAVSHTEGAMRSSQQSPGQIMNQRLDELSSGKGMGHEARVLETIQALSLEEINAAIEQLYRPENFTMVRVIPEP